MTTTSKENAADAKDKLPDLLNRVTHEKERIILTRREKEIAAIIPIEDFKILESLLSKNDLAEATEALKEARAHGTLTLDELKTTIG